MGKKQSLMTVTSALIMTGLLLPVVSGAANSNDDYELSPGVEDAYSNLMDDPTVNDALDFIESDHDNTIQDQIDLTEIPAPPFKEEKRAEDYKERFEDLDLEDVHIDEEGNVIGNRPRNGDGPTLVISAHLDTVFPEGTDVEVEEKDGKLYAPGIGDDGNGLASILTIVRAFNETNIHTTGDIMFVGTVGEEGEGDLRGVKHLFEERGDDIDGFISIEPGNVGRITHKGTGSHRYNFKYKGPGGHSFGAFGMPSPIHAMGRGISEIADLETPSDPKTTFNVGIVEGGTSVNSIAEEAIMKVDMRSNDEDELDKLDDKVQEIVKQSVKDENKRGNEDDKISVDPEMIGDRPAGSQPDDATNVQAAWASAEAIGEEPNLTGPSSTDSNVPISKGVPALTLGGGGEKGNTHSTDEWFDPTDSYLGAQRILMTALGLVGVEDVNDQILDEEDGDDGDDDNDGPKIENLEPAEDLDLQTGDSVKIEMDSEAGLHPTFSIRMPLVSTDAKDSSKNEFPMKETSEGHYVGYWTVPSNLKAEGAEPQVMISDKDGNETRKEAEGKLNINIKENN